MQSDDIRWLRRHAMLRPFGSAIATWILSVLAGEGQWWFWRNMEPVKSMTGIGTIGYGMVAVLGEGGIKLAFWAIDGHRKKLTAREINTLTAARNRLENEQNADGVASLDDMIEDRRRNPLRIGVGRQRNPLRLFVPRRRN